jgi:DNA-damage-inducible protein D
MSQLIPFEGEHLIRRIWHKDEWYYSIVDVIAFLTESPNPSSYWFQMKRQVQSEGFTRVREEVVSLPLQAKDKKFRNTDTCNRQTLLRLIQSIPSPKAEPLKEWLAQVGEERLEEIEHPEAAIERVREAYRKKGYEEDWIEQRIQNDLVRNDLTDEWKARGAKEGIEYAMLTNAISEGTFSLTVSAYKEYKLLPAKANLRDHMDTMELVLCSLGEATATLYHRTRNSQGFDELHEDTRSAGKLAGDTRLRIEEETNTKVISRNNKLNLIGKPKKKGKS